MNKIFKALSLFITFLVGTFLGTLIPTIQLLGYIMVTICFLCFGYLGYKSNPINKSREVKEE